MVWDYCSSGAAIAHAGKKVGTISGAGAILERWYIQAHGTVDAMTTKDFSGAALADIPQGIVESITSRLIAVDLIKDDMSVYTDQIEAEDMINIHRDIILRNSSILRDKETQRFMGA